ncbi:methyl-accepting chemotaxis protein [Melittangium boletus]|uniref:Chemotaxis protein n=1 Tax=Melittangium boletus DSM 14713 TaxID=1294270 RepID=A0A250IFV3_9BACT|nr:methyl-accepting chemotaxis protein [Melittangium boletus]ATB30138.1 chemotaxis protein [Melittangium boletus DSM 14713]
MSFKRKVFLLPTVATAFLLALLALSTWAGHDAAQLGGRIIRGYSPALASLRHLDALGSLLRWNLGTTAPTRDDVRSHTLRQLAEDFEHELVRVQANPVMESSRRKRLGEAFLSFWVQTQRALTLAEARDAGAAAAHAQALEQHAILQQTLRGSSEWAQAGLDRSSEEIVLLQQWRQRWVLSLGGLCILVLGGLSVWLARGVLRPLTRLTEVTTRIATEGDLTQHIGVDSKDEVGQLARGIEALVTRLRTVPVALQGTVDELERAAGQLSEATQRQLAWLGQQSRGLTEASETMEEIAQTSRLAASRAERVLTVAGQADQFSAAGRTSVESSARGLRQLRSRVEAMMANVAHLSEQAVRAGEIIGSVRDLADQSNVLALNASIEAARAGEEGRGFAVVAREMRALSGQSVQSTQRIGMILREINQAIRDTVSNAEQDSEQVEEGISQVLTSGDRLTEITTVVHESSQAARQIVASVTQQNAGITQMTQVIASLSQRMNDVVASTHDAEAAVGRLNTSLERLKRIAISFRV